MASMTEEKTLAEPRDKEALFHLLKGELTDAGLKGAARAVFETEEAKRGLWDAFKEDGIAAARGYFNRKVGVATGSNVDDTTWGALCARLQPDLSEHHYAALRAMKGTDRLQLQDMVKRGDAVSAIILFIELILPAAGKRKRDGANAGAVAQNARVGTSVPGVRNIVNHGAGQAQSWPAKDFYYNKRRLMLPGGVMLESAERKTSSSEKFVRRVCFWNLKGLSSVSAPDMSAFVWTDVARAVKSMGPNGPCIFVWTEANKVEGAVLNNLRNALPDYDIVNVAGTPFVYLVRNKSGLTVTHKLLQDEKFAHGLLHLECESDVPAFGGQPKGVAFFDVYSTHLMSKGDTTAHQQDVDRLIRFLKKLIARRNDPWQKKRFFVLGGDWNECANTFISGLTADEGQHLDGPRVPNGTLTMTPKASQKGDNDNVVAGPMNPEGRMRCGKFQFVKTEQGGLWKLDDWDNLSDHYPVFYVFAIEHPKD